MSVGLRGQAAQQAPGDVLGEILQTRNPHTVLDLTNKLDMADISDDSVRAYLLYYRGTAFGQLGDLDTCQYFLDRCREAISNQSFPLLQIQVLRAEGNVFWARDFFTISLQKYQEALLIAEVTGEIEYRISLLSNIAGVYHKLSDLEKAFEYINGAIDLAVEHGFYRPRTYLKKGRFAMELGRDEEAEDTLLEAIKYSIDYEDSIALYRVHGALAQLYASTDQLDKAEDQLNSLKTIGEAISFKDAYESVASVMYHAGRKDELQLTEALSEGIWHARSNNELIEGLTMLRTGSEFYADRGAWARAYDLQSQYLTIHDSLLSAAIQNKVYELEYQFATAQKEKALQETVAELKQKQIFQTFLTVIIFILIAVSVFVFVTQKQKNQLRQQVMTGEIAELRHQIRELLGKYEGQLEMGMDTLNDKLVNPLSQREFDVFQQIFSQKSSQEIADELFVSINTVKTHLKNIYSKLGVSNRKEALEVIRNDNA